MREGWEIKAFDACIEKRKAPTKLLSSSYQEKGLYPIVSQEKDLISGYWDNQDDLFVHRKPVVVFGDHTMVVKYIDFDFVVGADGVKILEPKEFLLPKYFFYWVSSVHIKSRGYARHFRYLREASVPIPSLPEQQRIVDILDREFAKIEALKANAEKSLQAAKDLFQATLKKELGGKTKNLATLLSICQSIVDCPHSTPIKSPEKTNFPCIRTSELKAGRISWATMQYVSEDEYRKRITRLQPQEGDIVYGREGTIGDAVMLPTGYHFCLGQRTMLFRPNRSLINPKYLLYCVISPFVYNQAMSRNTGCGVAHVNVADVKQFLIPVPEQIDEQRRIVSYLDALNDKCSKLQENYQKTLTLCDDLKQSLLRKAFNGEL